MDQSSGIGAPTALGNDHPVPTTVAGNEIHQVQQRHGPKLRRVGTTFSADRHGSSFRHPIASAINAPAPNECLRVGILQQKNLDTKGVVWFERLVMLTSERIYICKKDKSSASSEKCTPDNSIWGATIVLDYINLWEMVECDLTGDEEQIMQKQTEIAFRTTEDGRNCGRSYIFLASTDDAKAWVRQVKLARLNYQS